MHQNRCVIGWRLSILARVGLVGWARYFAHAETTNDTSPRGHKNVAHPTLLTVPGQPAIQLAGEGFAVVLAER